jgi:ATP/maltotriose-dependent transcriptional regulator MalT
MRQPYVGSCKLERRMRPIPQGQDTRSAVRVEERVERGSRAGGKSRIASELPSLVQGLVLLGQIALQQEDAVTACSLLEASATLARQIQEEQNGAEPTSLSAWMLAIQGNDAEAGILPEERLVQSRKGDDREAIVSGLAKGGGVAAQRRALMPKLTSQTLELVPAPRASVGSSAGLSAREVEVLRLVTQGLTDAQVAEQLVISPRTVNWHLSAIYSKLGVSCRSAATRYALEQQLI